MCPDALGYAAVIMCESMYSLPSGVYPFDLRGGSLAPMIARFLLLEYAKKIANCLVGRAQCQDSHIMTPEPGSVGFMGVNPAGFVPLQAALVGAGPPT